MAVVGLAPASLLASGLGMLRLQVFVRRYFPPCRRWDCLLDRSRGAAVLQLSTDAHRKVLARASLVLRPSGGLRASSGHVLVSGRARDCRAWLDVSHRPPVVSATSTWSMVFLVSLFVGGRRAGRATAVVCCRRRLTVVRARRHYLSCFGRLDDLGDEVDSDDGGDDGLVTVTGRPAPHPRVVASSGR